MEIIFYHKKYSSSGRLEDELRRSRNYYYYYLVQKENVHYITLLEKFLTWHNISSLEQLVKDEAPLQRILYRRSREEEQD